ncbi:hypothetical protein SNEBB_002818 [Seison nebaliae]|nr:hypothetical protein SNEBB_002818 [Seison nebaliae]
MFLNSLIGLTLISVYQTIVIDVQESSQRNPMKKFDRSGQKIRKSYETILKKDESVLRHFCSGKHDEPNRIFLNEDELSTNFQLSCGESKVSSSSWFKGRIKWKVHGNQTVYFEDQSMNLIYVNGINYEVVTSTIIECNKTREINKEILQESTCSHSLIDDDDVTSYKCEIFHVKFEKPKVFHENRQVSHHIIRRENLINLECRFWHNIPQNYISSQFIIWKHNNMEIMENSTIYSMSKNLLQINPKISKEIFGLYSCEVDLMLREMVYDYLNDENDNRHFDAEQNIGGIFDDYYAYDDTSFHQYSIDTKRKRIQHSIVNNYMKKIRLIDSTKNEFYLINKIIGNRINWNQFKTSRIISTTDNYQLNCAIKNSKNIIWFFNHQILSDENRFHHISSDGWIKLNIKHYLKKFEKRFSLEHFQETFNGIYACQFKEVTIDTFVEISPGISKLIDSYPKAFENLLRESSSAIVSSRKLKDNSISLKKNDSFQIVYTIPFHLKKLMEIEHLEMNLEWQMVNGNSKISTHVQNSKYFSLFSIDHHSVEMENVELTCYVISKKNRKFQLYQLQIYLSSRNLNEMQFLSHVHLKESINSFLRISDAKIQTSPDYQSDNYAAIFDGNLEYNDGEEMVIKKKKFIEKLTAEIDENLMMKDDNEKDCLICLLNDQMSESSKIILFRNDEISFDEKNEQLLLLTGNRSTNSDYIWQEGKFTCEVNRKYSPSIVWTELQAGFDKWRHVTITSGNLKFWNHKKITNIDLASYRLLDMDDIRINENKMESITFMKLSYPIYEDERLERINIQMENWNNYLEILDTPELLIDVNEINRKSYDCSTYQTFVAPFSKKDGIQLNNRRGNWLLNLKTLGKKKEKGLSSNQGELNIELEELLREWENNDILQCLTVNSDLTMTEFNKEEILSVKLKFVEKETYYLGEHKVIELNCTDGEIGDNVMNSISWIINGTHEIMARHSFMNTNDNFQLYPNGSLRINIGDKNVHLFEGDYYCISRKRNYKKIRTMYHLEYDSYESSIFSDDHHLKSKIEQLNDLTMKSKNISMISTTQRMSTNQLMIIIIGSLSAYVFCIVICIIIYRMCRQRLRNFDDEAKCFSIFSKKNNENEEDKGSNDLKKINKKFMCCNDDRLRWIMRDKVNSDTASSPTGVSTLTTTYRENEQDIFQKNCVITSGDEKYDEKHLTTDNSYRSNSISTAKSNRLRRNLSSSTNSSRQYMDNQMKQHNGKYLHPNSLRSHPHGSRNSSSSNNNNNNNNNNRNSHSANNSMKNNESHHNNNNNNNIFLLTHSDGSTVIHPSNNPLSIDDNENRNSHSNNNRHPRKINHSVEYLGNGIFMRDIEEIPINPSQQLIQSQQQQQQQQQQPHHPYQQNHSISMNPTAMMDNCQGINLPKTNLSGNEQFPTSNNHQFGSTKTKPSNQLTTTFGDLNMNENQFNSWRRKPNQEMNDYPTIQHKRNKGNSFTAHNLITRYKMTNGNDSQEYRRIPKTIMHNNNHHHHIQQQQQQQQSDQQQSHGYQPNVQYYNQHSYPIQSQYPQPQHNNLSPSIHDYGSVHLSNQTLSMKAPSSIALERQAIKLDGKSMKLGKCEDKATSSTSSIHLQSLHPTLPITGPIEDANSSLYAVDDDDNASDVIKLLLSPPISTTPIQFDMRFLAVILSIISMVVSMPNMRSNDRLMENDLNEALYRLLNEDIQRSDIYWPYFTEFKRFMPQGRFGKRHQTNSLLTKRFMPQGRFGKKNYYDMMPSFIPQGRFG